MSGDYGIIDARGIQNPAIDAAFLVWMAELKATLVFYGVEGNATVGKYVGQDGSHFYYESCRFGTHVLVSGRREYLASIQGDLQDIVAERMERGT